MALLTAFSTCSLDLRIADASGRFDRAEPPEAVHAFVNDRVRPVGTHLSGRRMFETMRSWETMPVEDGVMGDFGELWRAADEVVHSRTLAGVDTAHTRLEPRFDAEAVHALKASATAPLMIGGAELAGQALAAGLVDRLELLLVPVIVGEGPRAIPDGVGVRLALLEQTRLPEGWVHLVHAVGEPL